MAGQACRGRSHLLLCIPQTKPRLGQRPRESGPGSRESLWDQGESIARIVFFMMLPDREAVGSSVYLPISAKLSETDLAHIEALFADVFAVIQECRAGS